MRERKKEREKERERDRKREKEKKNAIAANHSTEIARVRLFSESITAHKSN